MPDAQVNRNCENHSPNAKCSETCNGAHGSGSHCELSEMSTRIYRIAHFSDSHLSDDAIEFDHTLALMQ